MSKFKFLSTACLLAGFGCLNIMPSLSAEAMQIQKIPEITLNNGYKMPYLGLGTYTLREDTAEAVKTALKLGYRHIDTAQAYKNEAEVYKGIEESGIDRKEIFITTKISPKNMYAHNVRTALDESLQKLGGNYIDLVLIHFPIKGNGLIKETWQILEEYVKNGKVRSIGISNFKKQHLDDLMSYAKIKPVLNQIEVHPYFTQEQNIADTKGYDIVVQGWSPFGSGVNNVLQDETLQKIAQKYNKSVAQIILRWNIQQNVLVIPRATNPDYIAENMQIFDFELSPEDMKTISGLNKNEPWNPLSDPDVVPWE